MKSDKPKGPRVPPESADTIRHGIVSLIERGEWSAKDISAELHISEKDVPEHLGHIARTLRHEGALLIVVPPECNHCGYVFKKRSRLTKPGRCPICLSTFVSAPRFRIKRG